MTIQSCLNLFDWKKAIKYVLNKLDRLVAGIGGVYKL